MYKEKIIYTKGNNNTRSSLILDGEERMCEEQFSTSVACEETIFSLCMNLCIFIGFYMMN